MTRIRLGRIGVDPLTLPQALDGIEHLVALRTGGFVVTPNVDHVVMAESNSMLRDTYAQAALSLIDGMPLVWLARLAGTPVPAKLSGSDFIRPLMQRAAHKHWRVYMLGGRPAIGDLASVGERAAAVLCGEYPGLQVVGTDAPPMGFERNPAQEAEVIERLRAAQPDIVLLALGCPKQELLMHRWRQRVAPAVMLGIGAGLDFIAGERKRAPAWLSRVGLEWLFRLLQEPRRLAHRYLVRDAAILPIALRTVWTSRRLPALRRALPR